MADLCTFPLKNLRAVTLAVSAVCLSQVALAAPFLTNKPFDLSVSVNGTYASASDTLVGGIQSTPLGFSSVEDMFNQSKNGGLTQVNSSYTNTSASVIRFGYRGMPLVLQTAANSQTVTLLIPGLNENVTFAAKATRDGNVDDVKEYLKNSGGDILNRLQQQLAKVSPIDPIAGNPNSMQSMMVSGDFDRNFTQFATNIKAAPGTDGASNNLIGVGLSFGNFTQGGLTNSVVTLPLSYTSRSDIDPRRQLTVYLPITVSDVAGAKTYSANLGVSYRLPMNDDWSLTPALGYGVSGSVDLGSAAAMLAASVTSQYTWKMGGFDLAMGNMLGLYQSSKFSAGGTSFDPQIRNTVLRNGLMASIPTQVMGRSMAMEFSFVNTLYSGTDLYSNQYNEIGATLGTNKGANSSRSYLRAGVTYLQGQNDIRGLRLNVGYWF
jgi:hypothetical protein